jgi:hypothetical protein
VGQPQADPFKRKQIWLCAWCGVLLPTAELLWEHLALGIQVPCRNCRRYTLIDDCLVQGGSATGTLDMIVL